MLSEEDRERIRRGYHLEHKSIRQLAQEEGYCRETIRKVIDPVLKRPQSPPRRSYPLPVLGPYQARVEGLFHSNARLPRKQRYSARRIFEVIREEGYQGCESTIRAYIARLKDASRTPDVFLPLEYERGRDAQVDWGEAYVVIKGEQQKIQFFVMCLCYSRRSFVMLFPTQRQECFLWGHVKAFEHFGGVPHRISYDNLSTAVQMVREKTSQSGRPRREVGAFTAFRSHYLFQSHFCTPAQGHEKGQVEGSVGFSRRHYLVPLPQGESLEEINQRLLQACLADDTRVVSRQSQTVGQAWEQERDLLLPLPLSVYECCQTKIVRLNPYGQVMYETNRYSVPVGKARRELTVKAYPFTIEIWEGLERLCSHSRSYERHLDVLDPLHYLPLLVQRPGAFDYTKPIKQWRKSWPASYEQLLANLRQKWPSGRGVQEFVRILQLHQTYDPQVVAQAIERALELGCVHLDGVIHCLRQLTPITIETEGAPTGDLDLSHRPELAAIATQPVDLSVYDRLLKQSW